MPIPLKGVWWGCEGSRDFEDSRTPGEFSGLDRTRLGYRGSAGAALPSTIGPARIGPWPGGLERQRKFGLRLALGGDWGGLVRMLAAEYLRITVLGGLLVRVFLAAAPPVDFAARPSPG